ncbi:MAG: hypothetical protein ACRC5C_15180 [Bacilli bacterium]
MKKWMQLMLVTTLSLTLAGCASEGGHAGHKNHSGAEEGIPELKVELTVTATGRTLQFEAAVTDEGGNMPEVKDMEFEVYRPDGTSEMVPGELVDARYTGTYSGKDAGEYRVIAHVSANDLHTMPEEKIVVK